MRGIDIGEMEAFDGCVGIAGAALAQHGLVNECLGEESSMVW